MDHREMEEVVASMKATVADLVERNAQCLAENNRLDRELDEARQVLKQPLRAPFSDEQIDKMAREASWSIGGWGYDNWDKGLMRDPWRAAVRRALAAGGLDPCPVPEYDPADVALTPSADEVDALARVMADAWANSQGNKPPVYLMDGYIAEARAAIAHLRPTQGHVLRDRLVEARRKVENQRVELARLNATVSDLRFQIADAHTQLVGRDVQIDGLKLSDKAIARELAEARAQLDALHPGETIEGILCERDHYRVQLDREQEWVGIYKKNRDDALAELAQVKAERDRLDAATRRLSEESAAATCELAALRDEIDDDNTNAAAVNDLLVKVQNLTAERDDAVAELAAVTKMRDEAIDKWKSVDDSLAKVVKERDAIRDELAALRQREIVPVKVRFSVSDERIQTLIELGTFIRLDLDKIAFLREVFAAHAVIDAPAGVPTAPTDAQVEALARVLRAQYWGEDRWDNEVIKANKKDWLGVARAAFAHFGAPERPKGLPTREEGGRILWNGINYNDQNEFDSPRFDDYMKGYDAILAALAPYLREPTLDVTAQEIYTEWYKADDRSHEGRWTAVLDLCRSRIRPVYECAECAAIRAERDEINRNYTGLVDLLLPHLRAAKADAARAALEGE